MCRKAIVYELLSYYYYYFLLPYVDHLKYVNYTIAEKDATQKTKTCSLTIHVNSTLDSVPNSFFGFSRDDKPQSYEKLKYPFKSRHCVTMAQRPTFLFQCRIEAAIGGCLGGNYLARVVQENETITKVLAAPHCELKYCMSTVADIYCHKRKVPPEHNVPLYS